MNRRTRKAVKMLQRRINADHAQGRATLLAGIPAHVFRAWMVAQPVGTDFTFRAIGRWGIGIREWRAVIGRAAAA